MPLPLASKVNSSNAHSISVVFYSKYGLIFSKMISENSERPASQFAQSLLVVFTVSPKPPRRVSEWIYSISLALTYERELRFMITDDTCRDSSDVYSYLEFEWL